MSCCAQIILRWCSFSVLNLVTSLSFESREEVAGGDIPLQNSESVSAVPILNPVCQCYIHIHLNHFFDLYKYKLPPFVQIMYQNNYFVFFFSLCSRM